jgi:hypothetical protein
MTAGAVLLAGVLGGGGVAQAKPPPAYPVSITVKVRPAPQYGCPECLAFSGSVTSPKPACKRNRKIDAVSRYRPGAPNGGQSFQEPYFDATDAQGRWNRLVDSFEPLAAVTVIVRKTRLPSGAICQAASATVKL